MNTRLRRDSVATRNASGSGTPALTIEDRMRLKRSTMACRTVGPTAGMPSRTRSRACLPPSVRTAKRYALSSARTTASTAHHQCAKKSVTASSIRVGSGSFAPRLWKKSLNRGKTKVASTTTVTSDIAAIIDG